MAFQNLSFENQGAAPGEADGWIITTLVTTEEIAGYGSPEKPQEDFETGWANDGYQFASVASSFLPATYAGPPARSVEDFEVGWTMDLGPL